MSCSRIFLSRRSFFKHRKFFIFSLVHPLTRVSSAFWTSLGCNNARHMASTNAPLQCLIFFSSQFSLLNVCTPVILHMPLFWNDPDSSLLRYSPLPVASRSSLKQKTTLSSTYLSCLWSLSPSLYLWKPWKFSQGRRWRVFVRDHLLILHYKPTFTT